MLILAKKFKNIFIKFKKTKGFTIVELLVSISIIAIMTSLFLVNYHSTNKRSELILSSQKMVADIRVAQNKSLGSEEYGSDNIPTGGWGVHIEKGSDNYKIFADDDGDFIFDAGEDNVLEGAENISLPNTVFIASTTVNSISVNSLDIVFLPPNPITYINGLDDATAFIILKEDPSSFSSSTIEVNYFGLIDNM